MVKRDCYWYQCVRQMGASIDCCTLASGLGDCPCSDGCRNYITNEEVTKRLKIQEPRVMTLEEVKQHNNQNGCVWFEQPTYNAVAAFVTKDDFMIQVISPYILGEPINHGYWTNYNYGKTWRCWTSRPTDAQREATPWN